MSDRRTKADLAREVAELRARLATLEKTTADLAAANARLAEMLVASPLPSFPPLRRGLHRADARIVRLVDGRRSALT